MKKINFTTIILISIDHFQIKYILQDLEALWHSDTYNKHKEYNKETFTIFIHGIWFWLLFANISKGTNNGNSIGEFFLILVVMLFQQCLMDPVAYIFIELTWAHLLVKDHIWRGKAGKRLKQLSCGMPQISILWNLDNILHLKIGMTPSQTSKYTILQMKVYLCSNVVQERLGKSIIIINHFFSNM